MTKNIIILAIASLCISQASAQCEKGSWSIAPKVGMNLTNCDYEMNLWESGFGLGFSGGMEFEYDLTNSQAISLGAEFRKQHFKLGYSGKDDTWKTSFETDKGEANILSVPLQYKYFVLPNLSINAGVAFNFNLASYVIYDMTNIHITFENITDFSDPSKIDLSKAEYTTTSGTKSDDYIKLSMKDFYVDIPLGVSYEYQNFVFNATYHFRPKEEKFNYKNKINHGMPIWVSEIYTEAKMHTINISLAYKFRL